MNNPATDGIHLTKQYHREHFRPNDFQCSVTKIADDFTLYDVFKLIDLAERVTPGIAKTFGMENFDVFWGQINKDRDPKYGVQLKYLELYWEAKYELGNDAHSEDPTRSELPGLMSLHGIGPGCVCKDRVDSPANCECPETRGYGIEFTPVNNLAYLPIRVLPNVQFSPPFSRNEKSFRYTGFSLRIDPTLWCFITSIFCELTFVDSTPNKIEDSAKRIFDMTKTTRRIV